MKRIIYTKEEQLVKIKQYCVYQERCIAEVSEKVYSFALNKNEAEEIISQLIEENYLNENRFAIQFARGKFGIKQWGKIKIKHALKQKEISEYSIKKALKQIDENDYKKTLNKLTAQKLKTLKSEKNIFNKRKKLYNYLLQKGYEGTMIKEAADKQIV